jgi:hypothetical protein
MIGGRLEPRLSHAPPVAGSPEMRKRYLIKGQTFYKINAQGLCRLPGSPHQCRSLFAPSPGFRGGEAFVFEWSA